MAKKRKFKEKFTTFRSDEKSPYTTIKIKLRSVLLNSKQMQPEINNLVFDMNDLIINTYQFIRLYILHKYSNGLLLPDINTTFILYCIKTLGVKDPRGPKAKDTQLLDELNKFYDNEYKNLVKHEKTNLIGKSHLLSYLATQIYTSLHNNVQEHFIQHLLRFINITVKNITDNKKQFMY